MVQIIPQDTPSSLFGSGLGQGLAEQLPKEIERHRLSQGLQQLQNNPQGSLYQQAAALYGTPGVTPEMVSTLLPLLERERRNQSLQQQKQQTKPQRGPKSVQPKFQEQPPGASQFSDVQPSQAQGIEDSGGQVGLRTPGTIEALRHIVREPTQQEVLDRASEMDSYLYPTPEEKIAAAKDAFARENQQITAQQELGGRESALENEAVKEFSEYLSTVKAPLEGELLKKYTEEMYRDIDKGMTPKTAAKKYGERALQYDKARTTLGEVSVRNFLPQKRDAAKSSLKNIKEEYKKADALQFLPLDLQSFQGFSPGAAYYFAYPPTDNTKAGKEIKNSKSLERIVSGDPNAIQKLTKEKARQIAKNITPNDSPLAMAFALKSKMYDPVVFLSELNALKDELPLNERQRTELNKVHTSMDHTLSDLFYFAWGGLE